MSRVEAYAAGHATIRATAFWPWISPVRSNAGLLTVAAGVTCRFIVT